MNILYKLLFHVRANLWRPAREMVFGETVECEWSTPDPFWFHSLDYYSLCDNSSRTWRDLS